MCRNDLLFPEKYAKIIEVLTESFQDLVSDSGYKKVHYQKITTGEKLMDMIENMTYDSERALYNIRNTLVKNCRFAGPADGESVLKETRDIIIENCSFSLRYPIWHAEKYELRNSQLDEKTRASLWYSDDGMIENTDICGVKALRECNNTVIRNCRIESVEFGWKTNNTKILEMKVNDLAKAVDRVSVVAERTRAIKMIANKNHVMITSSSPDLGSALEEVEASYESESLEIGYNYRYLLDILAEIKGETAKISFNDSSSPSVIHDTSDTSAIYVLMPMRV